MVVDPNPQVTLPAGGSAAPVTASVSTLQMSFGPAVFFRSGPTTVTTKGTPGPTGSVTSSTSFEPTAGTDSSPCNFSYVTSFTADSPVVTSATANFTSADVGKVAYSGFLPPNNPHPESEQIANIVSVESPTQATLSVNATGDGTGYLTIDRSVGSCVYNSAFSTDTASTTCTTNQAGTTASTHFTGGLLVTETDDYMGPTVIVPIPDDPAPNTTIDGYFWLNGSSKEEFTYVLNEQTPNPDGSLTVVAAHLTPRGPIAHGDAYFGGATCGGTITPIVAPDSLSVSDVAVNEGNTGTTAATFTVSRSGNASAPSTVKYKTSGGTATAGTDYSGPVPLTDLSFAAGETSKPVTVNVTGDNLPEMDETLTLVLSAPTGAVLGDSSGTATILNDDGAALLSVNSLSVDEGNAGNTPVTFTVTRSGNTNGSSTVTYKTSGGTAAAGADYAVVSPTPVTFAAGESSKTVTTNVVGDTTDEANETFNLVLSAPVGATLADTSGTAYITDEDGSVTAPVAPTFVSVDDPILSEGNSGTTATFTVTRSGVTTGGSTVKYKTSGGTATAGVDYTAPAPTASVNFAANELTKTVAIPIVGDNLPEKNETFNLVLSAPIGATIADPTGTATILNDDGSAYVSVGNVSVAEGNSGTTPATFTITRSGNTNGSSTVSYRTSGGTALAPSDYAAVPLTALTFAAGETTKTVDVTVNGDTTVEKSETFNLVLSAPIGATLSDPSGAGTIVNDD
jgi:hypothetical protein